MSRTFSSSQRCIARINSCSIRTAFRCCATTRAQARASHASAPRPLCNPRVSVESPDDLKGAIELDCDSSVKRTKNVRDGFEYCIRVDSPNAGNGAKSVSTTNPKVKRWTKLVMVLNSEPGMTSWIQAIRWVLKTAAGSVSQLVAAAPAPQDVHVDTPATTIIFFAAHGEEKGEENNLL